MRAFLRSTSGRLVAFSFALVLLGGGVSVHLSDMTRLYVMTMTVFIGIVGGVAALQLAVEEFERAAILSSIIFPVALFLYAVALNVSTAFHPSWSYGFIALGIAFLIVGLRSVLGAASEPALRQATAPAAE